MTSLSMRTYSILPHDTGREHMHGKQSNTSLLSFRIFVDGLIF